MRATAPEVLQATKVQRWAPEELLRTLVEAEIAARDDARTSEMNTWRAGCGGSRRSGSEGEPEKPISREVDRALRLDPYTEHPTREGNSTAA